MVRRIAILTLKEKLEMYNDELKNEFEDTEIVQYGADNSYEKLIKTAIDLERSGYEAIICRGFSENIISSHVSIPIILLEPDMSDVLRAVTESDVKKNDQVAMVLHAKNNLLTYSNIPYFLKKIFDLDVEIFTYTSAQDFDRVVEKALDANKHLFSSNLAIKAANRRGVSSSLFCVGMNAIREAVIEAIKIVDVRRRDAIQNEKVRLILNHSEEGIVCMDETMHVEWINDYAREVLEIDHNESQDIIRVHDCMPNLNWENIFDQEIIDVVTMTSHDKRLIVSAKPYKSKNSPRETFIFFRDVSDVVEDEKIVRAELHRRGVFAKYNLEDIKGESPAILQCKEETKRCAEFDTNVLICGESGVGKELFAQCIHNNSKRRKEAFYAINCASLPSNLLESELFGYSDGAFTGAKKGGKAGIFEMAHNGTVFLDEIGELPTTSQSALLRVIQAREVRRIGDDAIIPVDVRIIAASNKDIQREVWEKRFREDLFYRLNTVFLNIPPLRERGEDVIVLFEDIARREAKKNGLSYNGTLSEDARKYLLNYSWRGNVRELENFVQRLFVFGYYDKVITEEDVSILLNNALDSEYSREPEPDNSFYIKRKKAVAEDVKRALLETKGNRSEAAKILGISRTHLWRLINEFKEETPDSREIKS